MAKYFFCFFLLLVFISGMEVFGQGIKGRIVSDSGDPLAYCSVFVRNINDGIPTNENGHYSMTLLPGHYDILIQHLGYRSEQRTVEIVDQWVELNFTLELQTYALQEVEVESDSEDPALTIMRKAISKAKFHRLQIQEYSMMVYIKGTGQLTDAPFFMKKKLKEEGIGLNEAFTQESVSQITFKQPNHIEEKVISVRASGEQNQTSPAPYIGASFYHPKINEAISPLSPSAFSYYRFRFEGSFFEGETLVNKIKVTPRSRGERVFEGYIYIIEDLWMIHGLDLKTSLMGFDIRVTQQYSPVEENIWMPLTHTYAFGGSFFGFAGKYQYLASTRDYKIKLNPELVLETEILDEKVDEIPEEVNTYDKNTPAVNQLAESGEMSRKDFRKMINQYEKESKKVRENAEVISERKYFVDSLAHKRSQTYWDSIRPVQLSLKEIQGYKRDDSLALVEEAKDSEVDSVAQKARKKFKPLTVFTGGTYFLGNGRSVGFHTNLTKISFNTVEGFKMGLSGFYSWKETQTTEDSLLNLETSWNIRPEIRYGFASRKTYGTLEIKRSSFREGRGHHLGIVGGKYIYQYNRDNPISEQVNAIYSLLFRQNYMKMFDQVFGKMYWEQFLSDGFNFRIQTEFSRRNPLANESLYSFYDKEGREFNSNQPNNLEAPQSAFELHRAWTLNFQASWRPGLKYNIRNGRKFALYETAPQLTLTYKKGIPTSLNAAEFDLVGLGISHAIQFGVSGKLEFNIQAGTFFNNQNVYFMDYQHFGGNRTIFSDMGAASNYRFLDYYQYSTQQKYLSSILHYQFRKFLFTQLPLLRYSGLRENVFFNYLKTPDSPHYVEIGYSLDNLYRIFRVEMGAGFENGKYSRGGLRFGIATFIDINIGE